MDNIPQLPNMTNTSRHFEKPKYLTNWQSSSLQYISKIKNILIQFSSSDSFNPIWEDYGKDCERQISIVEKSTPCLKQVLEQFPSHNHPDRVELIVNLLDAKGRGYSLSSHETTWIFLNPVTANLLELENLILHEMLHRWVDPIAEKKITGCECSSLMQNASAVFRIVSESYREYPIWVGETVVRAATAWCMREKTNPEQSLQHLEKMGFVGVQKAFDFIVCNSNKPLYRMLPTLIDLVSEDISSFTKNV